MACTACQLLTYYSKQQKLATIPRMVQWTLNIFISLPIAKSSQNFPTF